MEQEPQKNITRFDLYVFRDAKWSIHHSYEKNAKDEALKDSKDLEKEGAYIGICLVDNVTKNILFEHNTRGDKLTYLIVTTNSTGYVGSSKNNYKKAKIVDKSNKENSPSLTEFMPIIVALTSLTIAGFIAKKLLENSISPSFKLPLAIAVGGLLVAFILNLKQQNKNNNSKRIENKITDKKWQKLEEITRDAIGEFKINSLDENGEIIGDSYFGITLMSIAIGDEAIKTYDLPEEEVKEKIISILEEFDIPSHAVDNTWQNIYEYLAYPRYKRMYDEGRFIVKEREKNWNADTEIAREVKLWVGNKDKSEVKEEKIAAILFTDIVNFTGSHQRLGDEWMVDVVKAHNEIVRTALKSFRGKEVKHTGDGIMASFPTAVLATKAAEAMQKGFIKFSKAVPARRFEVRVGVSAGEPIHMGDDLFGTPVNLAARVMSHGEGGDIMLSSSAYENCNELDMGFEKVEGCQLKGFNGDRILYRLKTTLEKQKPKVREDIGKSFEDKETSFLK